MVGNRFIWSSWSKKAKLEIFSNVDKVEDFLKSADEIAESGIAIKELRRSAKKGEWSKVVDSGLKPGKLVDDGMSSLRNKMRTDKGIPDSWDFSPAKDPDGISFHRPGT